MTDARQITIDLYSELGIKYEQAFTNVPAQVRSLEWVISNLQPGAKVLDVGCGTGKPASAMLSAAGHDVLGIDLTPKMIEIAESQVQNARFQVADSRRWDPEQLGGYDCVVAYFSFIAGVSQKDIREFFPRAYSWLKKGGIFIFATVPLDGDNIDIKWMGKRAVGSSLKEEDVVDAIEQSGFDVVHQELEPYLPKAKAAGLKEEDVWEESELFVYARKGDPKESGEKL